MIGRFLSYDFIMRVKKKEFELKFLEEVQDWNKLEKSGRRRRHLRHLVNGIKNAKEAVIETIKLEGPFELRASGNDHLSIQLPLKRLISGLNRVLVGEGITVKVEGAREVSLFQTSSLADKFERDMFGQLLNPCCMRVPTVIISASSTLRAYNPQNPEASILGTYVSERVIKLMRRKCSSDIGKQRAGPMPILRSKVTLVDKLAESLYGSKDPHRNRSSSIYLSATIKASKVIRFNLELERKVRKIDDLHNMLPKWRTRPSVERTWFRVVAKYGSGKLNPLLIKKLKPFTVVVSATWSSLMSNISFTKFPSLAPPDPFTLDVRW